MQYKIYKLQNKINNKIYIGKTKRSLSQRLVEHRKTENCRYIHRAIKKYGEDLFTKEIIYETDDENDICKKEQEYIIKYNSLVPNGYNLVLDTNQGRFFHKTTRELMSKNTQGTIRSEKIWSKYIGIRSRKPSKIFSVRITKNKKTYCRYYDNEIIAAEAYDKVVLYLYGLNAKINFPEKIEIYRTINLKEFFNEFCKKHKKSSIYEGIIYAPYIKNNKWRAIIYKNKKQINIGCFKTEIEAYEARKKYIDENKQ